MKRIVLSVFAVFCLAACLLAAVLMFRGILPLERGKIVFLFLSAGWFVFASTAQLLGKRKHNS